MAGTSPTAGNNQDNSGRWGSDIIADALREQNVPYVCLVPGASFRGLHDSIVNYLGNEAPKIIVCLHEEHSVAIAHGWAQVTNEPLAAIVHTNVGLMHATMTMFNAWCDRAPALVLGAAGPFDSEKRRPWIDWIHTAIDQGALVRDYTKWDDQPGSAASAVDAIRRGGWMARTAPMGPVYINLDVAIQEEWVENAPEFYDGSQYQPPRPAVPAKDDIDAAYEILARAKHPVMLVGRVSRDQTAWDERIKLAEMFGAQVYTLYNVGGGFPKAHPLHKQVLQLTIDDEVADELRQADAILSLDWSDLGGTVEQVWPRGGGIPDIVSVSNDFHLHRGWSMDYHRIQPAAVRVATTPDAFASAMLGRGADHEPKKIEGSASLWQHAAKETGTIGMRDLAAIFNDVMENEKVTMVSRTIGWPHPAIKVEGPLDFLGSKGGEGLGAGPGMAVGAALAIRDRHPERVVATVVGDGDFLMGATALWTAAAENIPLLVIVANNRSYYNDVVHQERVARRRERPIENKWIGLEINNPAPDIAGLARSLGTEATGPISEIEELRPALEEALKRVKAGSVYVLEVLVEAGYAAPVAGKD